jgi:ABC-type transport system substrate-binding protein
MPYYSGATCGSRVRNLVFHAYKSIARMIKAATAHQTDITTNYNLPDVPDLAKHLSAYRVHIQTSFALEHLEFNVDRTYHGQLNPLGNTDVRLALALALDKYALIRQGLAVGASAAQQMAAWSPFVDTGDLKQPFVTSHLTGQWDPIAHSYVIPGTRTALAHARTLLARTPFKRDSRSICTRPWEAQHDRLKKRPLQPAGKGRCHRGAELCLQR